MLVIVSIALTDVKRSRILGIEAPLIAAPSINPKPAELNV